MYIKWGFLLLAVSTHEAPIPIALIEDEVSKNILQMCTSSIRDIAHVDIYCRDIGLDYIPHIPHFTTLLIMDFNNIPVLNFERFELANMPNLRELHLSNCHIQTVHPDTFKGKHTTQKLEKLYLSNNELESLSEITIALVKYTPIHLQLVDARNSTREPSKTEECVEMKAALPDVEVYCDDPITGNIPTTRQPIHDSITGNIPTTRQPIHDTITGNIPTTRQPIHDTITGNIPTTSQPTPVTSSELEENEKDVPTTDPLMPNTGMVIELVLGFLVSIAIFGLIFNCYKYKKKSTAHMTDGVEILREESPADGSSSCLVTPTTDRANRPHLLPPVIEI